LNLNWELLQIAQKLEGRIFGVSLQFFEHFEGIEYHIHIHQPDPDLEIRFHRVESRPQILSHRVDIRLVLALAGHVGSLFLLQLELHLLPDLYRSVEILFCVVQIDQDLVTVRVHLEVEFLVERQDQALDLGVLESVCVGKHDVVEDRSVQHVLVYDFLQKFPGVGKHQFPLLLGNFRNEAALGVGSYQAVVDDHCGLNLLELHYLS
jgi:hypothetical protein